MKNDESFLQLYHKRYRNKFFLCFYTVIETLVANVRELEITSVEKLLHNLWQHAVMHYHFIPTNAFTYVLT